MPDEMEQYQIDESVYRTIYLELQLIMQVDEPGDLIIIDEVLLQRDDSVAEGQEMDEMVLTD